MFLTLQSIYHGKMKIRQKSLKLCKKTNFRLIKDNYKEKTRNFGKEI